MKSSHSIPDHWFAGEPKLIATTPTSTVYRLTGPDGVDRIAKCLTALGIQYESLGGAYLEWRKGNGCALLLDQIDNCLLLEDAGTKSLQSFWEEENEKPAFTIAAQLLVRLFTSSNDCPPKLLPLETHLASLLKVPRDGELATERELFELARSYAREMLNSSPDPIPLHGDLHHENILLSPRGWLAIDPHGLLGDPGYEAANLFSNPRDATDVISKPQRAAALAREISSATGMSSNRLLKWGAVHACLSAKWADEDDGSVPVPRFRSSRIKSALACVQALDLMTAG